MRARSWEPCLRIFILGLWIYLFPVEKMASVSLFIVMAVLQQWPLYQLDVKNVFLNGDLQEKSIWNNLLGLLLRGSLLGCMSSSQIPIWPKIIS